VIHLDVPASVIVERLSARRQCVCGRVYNLLRQRPKIDGQCDECGHQLTVRSDDDPVVIERRLHAYQKSTGPVLAHYAGVSYYAVDGNRDSETVFAEVLGIVQPVLHK
jgi:adenylate kinase